MRRGLFVGGAVVCLLLSGGLATATPPAPPPADPIGDVIAQPGTPDVLPQEPTSAPILSPDAVPVAPEVLEDAGLATSEEDLGPVEFDEGRPLPPIPAALPRVRQQVVIVQALDKVTAETIRFAVPVGQSRRWRGLVFRARACETTAADEPMRDSMGYLEVRSQPRSRDGQEAGGDRQVFQGWMFASSPALNPLEHPLYDAWVISCQASMPES